MLDAGLVVAESGDEVAAPDGWTQLRVRRHGRTVVTTLRAVTVGPTDYPASRRIARTADQRALSRQLRSDPSRPRRRHRAGGRAVRRRSWSRRCTTATKPEWHVHHRPAGRDDHRQPRPPRRHPGRAVHAAWPSTRPREFGVDFIVKGLRNAGDFEIEQQMAHTNQSVGGCPHRVPAVPARSGVPQQPFHPRDRAVRWRCFASGARPGRRCNSA